MKIVPLFIGIVLVTAIGVGIAVIVKSSGSAHHTDPEDAPAPDVTPLVTVHTNVLRNITLHEYVSAFGAVEPAPASSNGSAAGVQLAAPSAGIAVAVHVVAGQRVEAGAALAEFNSAPITYTAAKAELDRQRKLLAGQNTSIKKLQDAEAQLATLELISPIGGTVTRVAVSAGESVDGKTTIIEIVDLNRLIVSVRIPGSAGGALKVGDPLQVTSPAAAETHLAFVSPALDPADGTIAAWGILPMESGLRPGQTIEARVIISTHTNCLAAPAESLTSSESGAFAIALLRGDQASITPVKTGLREAGWVEILEPPLKPGDIVITTGAYGLTDKIKVRLANAPPMPDSPANPAKPE